MRTITLLPVSAFLAIGWAIGSEDQRLQSIDDDQPGLDNTTAEMASPSVVDAVWRVNVGDLCHITRSPLPSSETSSYLQCARPHDDTRLWPWTDTGVWTLRRCPRGRQFHPVSRACRTVRYIKRQQSACLANPSLQSCPQPQQQQYSVQPQQNLVCQCPAGVRLCACPQPGGYRPVPVPPQAPNCAPPPSGYQQGPQPCPQAGGPVGSAGAGAPCSWMLSPLAADPTNGRAFLQCAPAPGNVYCGRWVRMPCAPGTVFDVTAQVCVHDQSSAPPPGMAGQCTTGLAIGPCNANMQCPGQSVCQQQPCQSQPAQPCATCCYTGASGNYGPPTD